MNSAFIIEEKKTFGPAHCKPHLPDPYTHRARIPPDDGGPITFHWHFQRGLLKPRMSGLELATFVLNHMPSILPFFSEQPRVKREFETMMILLATSKQQAVDRLLPWIRSITKQADDDVIHMSLFDRTEQPKQAWFVLGGN